MGKCLSSKVLRTSNNIFKDKVQIFLIIFASFSCPCDIIWNYLGASLLKGLCRLCWSYSTSSTPGQILTSPCSKSAQNYWKKCLLPFLFEQTEHIGFNLITTTWSTQRSEKRDSVSAELVCPVRWMPFPWSPVYVNFSNADCLISEVLFSHRYVSTLVHMRQIRVSEVSFSKKSLSKLKYRNEMSAMKNAEGSKQIY